MVGVRDVRARASGRSAASLIEHLVECQRELRQDRGFDALLAREIFVIRDVRATLIARRAELQHFHRPLILLDERRRIVRANAQTAGFIGLTPEPRDLAAALRNPTVLAAADSVLRGDRTRVIDFSLTLPVERQLRAGKVKALKGYLGGDLERGSAAEQIADNYLRFIKVYEDAEAGARV